MSAKQGLCVTYWVRIYIAGPIAVAEQVCREECMREGLCVTVDPTRFIYKGGEEAGVVVGLLNYPRFPSTPEMLLARARVLAELLRVKLCQDSVLIQAPDITEWMSNRA